jgi:LAO/AO transport system kinase
MGDAVVTLPHERTVRVGITGAPGTGLQWVHSSPMTTGILAMTSASSQVLGPRRRQLTEEDYYAGVRAKDVTILARTLTLFESSNPHHQALAEHLLTRLLPHTGQSLRVGITGAPGSGKSTFIEALGLRLIGRGLRVAVLAVDPSSGISGGSILGDKTRMPWLSAEPDAYIRPSPAAGTLGGVARKTRESMLVCEAAGYQVVLIETVGVGQSETVVADMTDCFLALMLPGAGDELQGIKRGLLELVDVLAVNKADGSNRAAAELAAQQYRDALHSLAGGQGDPRAVLTCSALHGHGVDAVWDTIERCHAELAESGELAQRRQRQNLRWLWALVEDQIRQAVHNHPEVRAIRDDLEREVLAGTSPAATAARRILEAFSIRPAGPSS